jgi:hypothetical protein
MIFPTIHLNGTSKDDLLEALMEANAAIRDAQKKLAETAPNGRDYYPQGPNVIYQAQDEHVARMNKLVEVERELSEIAEHLAFLETR